MILASGCFDGIHAGHVAYLAAARVLCARGEELWVAVAPDDYIRTMKSREPYWPASDRLFALAAVHGVDRVVIGHLAAVTCRSKPRIVVKGVEWAPSLPAAVVDACRDVGAEIVYVPTGGRHTSEAMQ